MALNVDWDAKIIMIQKGDMTLKQTTPYEVRELNVNDFRLELKNVEDSEIGIVFPDIHKHNTESTLAGTTFARTVEVINDYTVTFEDGQYAVNLIGANNNISDVLNLNQVSVRSFNSAGLTNPKTGASHSEF